MSVQRFFDKKKKKNWSAFQSRILRANDDLIKIVLYLIIEMEKEATTAPNGPSK